MKPGSGLADATLQRMRHTKGISNLAHVPLAAILRHAGAADDLQVRNFCQIGQDFILHAVREKRVLFAFAEIFERQNRDAFLGCS